MQTYINLANTLHAKPPITIGKGCTIHGDNEIKSKEFQDMCIANKITLHTTPPHTPQLNPKAERAWLTIYNATRAMLYTMETNTK